MCNANRCLKFILRFCRPCQGRPLLRESPLSSLSWLATVAQVLQLPTPVEYRTCLTSSDVNCHLHVSDGCKTSISFHAGKTTFVKRHLTGEFEKKYERKFWATSEPMAGTLRLDVHCLKHAKPWTCRREAS